MQKFLIIKTSSLGDIIQTFPTANYLRQKFPTATIDWVVEYPFSELVAANPDIKEVIVVNTKQWRKNFWSVQTWKEMGEVKRKIRGKDYDVIFDVQGNGKSGLITFFSIGKAKVGFGWKTVHEKLNLLFTNQKFNPQTKANIRDDYLGVVQAFFNDNTPFLPITHTLKLSLEQQALLEGVHKKMSTLKSPQPKIMVCPGSAWPNKQLTQEALLDFLHRLHKYASPLFVLVWGSRAEQEWAQVIHQDFPVGSLLMERLPLPVLQNLMDEMNLVIAMDSLPLHLAGTTRAATFSIFGPSLAQKFKPQGIQHAALQGQCPYNRQFEKRCPILRSCPTGACIKTLTGDAVFNSFLAQKAYNLWSRKNE
jgi:heptosyltransferase-1